jgi:hypothetical protein
VGSYLASSLQLSSSLLVSSLYCVSLYLPFAVITSLGTAIYKLPHPLLSFALSVCAAMQDDGGPDSHGFCFLNNISIGNGMQFTSLHCTSLYCTALHCTVLYCTSFQRTVLHCTVLHYSALHCTVLYCTALPCTAPHCTVLHFTVLQCRRTCSTFPLVLSSLYVPLPLHLHLPPLPSPLSSPVT